MTALWLRVVWVSATTSVVLLPLMLWSKALFARYRSGSLRLLWLALCLRLLIPLQVPLPRPAVTVEAPALTLVLPQGGAERPSGAARPDAAPARDLSPVQVSAGLWLAGMVATAVWHVGGYWVLKRKVRKNARVLSGDAALARALGSKAPVLRSDVEGPMTMGLLRPVILLPRRLEEGDVELVLRHELCHLRRGDVWYKALFLACGCVHWFNPLVWKLARRAGDTVELCCDEAVVRGRDDLFRRRYGQLLLRTAAAPGAWPAVTSFGSGDLKGRLMNLFVTKKTGTALVCLCACAALMLGSLVGCRAEAKEIQPAPAESAPQAAESSAPPAESAAPEEGWLWPVEGEYTLSALYGKRVHPLTGKTTEHSGLDIAAQAETPVLAAGSGVVEQAEFDTVYGNYVLVAHDDGRSTLYGHMSQLEVEQGEQVERGDLLGLVGRTGQATGEHLHFELRAASGATADPLDLYPGVELTAAGVAENVPGAS